MVSVYSYNFGVRFSVTVSDVRLLIVCGACLELLLWLEVSAYGVCYT